jgi:hypothetical protein
MSLCPTAVFALAVLVPTAVARPGSAAPSGDSAGAYGPWEPVRDDDGILVHRRAVRGSKLHEFRGVGLVEAPIALLLGVLDDSDHRTEWMQEARANNRIERVGAFGEIFYSRTRAPWPVADRDVVLQATTTFDTSARQVRIEFVSVSHPAWPPQTGAVRMPFLHGHWYMTPVHGGAWTRIEYQIHADPGGLLPTWVINLVSKKIPHDTIAALREQINRRRYPEFEKRMAALPDYLVIVGAPSTPVADQMKKETP